MEDDKQLESLIVDELEAITAYQKADAQYWKGDQTEKEKLAMHEAAHRYVAARKAVLEYSKRV